MLEHIRQILIEIDDELAEMLERVAPTRRRRRSDFVRYAIRQALWDLEEQATAEAYRQQPDSPTDAYLVANVWGRRPWPYKTRRKR